MSERIKLVQGDNRPVITLTLIDTADGNVLDLSATTTHVSVKFRAVGSTDVLQEYPCVKSNGGADGVVEFRFTDGLDVDAGLYEGEIFIDWNGEIETVYDPLKFKVREDF